MIHSCRESWRGLAADELSTPFVSDLPGTVHAGISSTLLSAPRSGTFELLRANVSVEIEKLPSVAFLRGDCNGDGRGDISDAIYALNSLSGSGPNPPCREACDSNGDRTYDISDAIFELNFLFGSGPRPIDPGPDDCGPDPDPEGSLGCERPPRNCERYSAQEKTLARPFATHYFGKCSTVDSSPWSRIDSSPRPFDRRSMPVSSLRIQPFDSGAFVS